MDIFKLHFLHLYVQNIIHARIIVAPMKRSPFTIRRRFSTADEARILLRRFILPNPPGMDEHNELPNPSLNAIYDAWNIHRSKNLPLFSPLPQTPFQYYSKHNSESNLLKGPRLSVTKLLVDSWCQLSQYYQVYAGSLRFRSKAMKVGQDYHTLLESRSHEKIDTAALQDQLKDVLKSVEAVEPGEGIDAEKVVSMLELVETITGNADESELARDWSIQIVSRLFLLITSSDAREVLVHCFVDLEKKSFVKDFHRPMHGHSDASMVLVSGVVDQFLLSNSKNPLDLSLFEDIRDSIDYHFNTAVNGYQVVELSKFFELVQPIINSHSHDFKVSTSDVKTRSRSTIPPQDSVITAAKFQTFYYRKMLGILANPKNNFAYFSLLENAKVRKLDIDAPVNATVIVRLLRENFHLYYDDFGKLANGEPIGFAPFDDYETPSKRYDLRFIDIEGENDLTHEADNYKELLTEKLLTNWKTPPTLRYFAARSSQFYGMLGKVLGEETTVEYHSGGHCFHVNKYKFDLEALDEQLIDASSFWNGERFPQHTTDLEKCSYCDFREKCKVPNGLTSPIPHRSEIGYKLNKFVFEN